MAGKVFGIWFYAGWPRIWQKPAIPPKIPEARAAITYFGSASTPADNGTNTASPTAVTPPANMQKGDLVILIAAARATSGTISMYDYRYETISCLAFSLFSLFSLLVTRRRRWDSNPRTPEGVPVFKTGAIATMRLLHLIYFYHKKYLLTN